MIVRLAQTAAGTGEPNAHQVQWFIDQFGERLRIWAKVGLAKSRDLLAVSRKLAAEGVTHVVIDSLMKLDISSQDFEAQRNFANLVAATAQQTGCHIHLVAHPKKPKDANDDPDLNDVAGAKELGGIADNVIFVRRREIVGCSKTTGMRIHICKQRHGNGYVGNIDGFFHRDMRQFSLEQFPAGPRRYLPADAYINIGDYA
jgi:twinkle protein